MRGTIEGRLCVIAIATSAACGPERVQVAAVSDLIADDLPFVGLIAYRSGAPITSIGLVDREAAKSLSLEVEDGDEIELFGYREETLALVGAPGADILSLNPLVTVEQGPALPPPDLQLRGLVADGAAALEPDAPLRRVSASWCTAPEPCEYWGLSSVEMPLEILSVRVRTLERWSDHEVLVLTTEAELRLVDVDLEQVQPAVALAPELAPNALFSRGPRDLFGVGLNGQFVHAGPEFEVRAQPVAFPLVAQANVELSGSPSELPLELFALVDGRSLLRYHEGLWSVVFEAVGAAPGGGIVRWLGPDRAVAALEGEREVVIYESGRTSRLRLPGDPPPKTVAHVEGIGILVGTHQGRIYRVAGEDFELYLDLQGTLERVTHIEGFDGGFVFFQGGSHVGAFHDRHGTCTPRLVTPTSSKFGPIIDLGSRLVTASRPADELPAGIVRIDRGPKPSPRCFLQ